MLVKFIYFEKATKFDEINLFFDITNIDVQKTVISSNFVAFSENLNFSFSTSLFGIFQMRVEFFQSSVLTFVRKADERA